MVKTIQHHAVEAYKVLVRYSKENFQNRTVALKLFYLKKALKPSWDFQLEQDQVILRACNGVSDDYGNVSFPGDTGENKTKWVEMVNDLATTEVEIDTDPIELKLDDVPRLTIEDMEGLDGFVNFAE